VILSLLSITDFVIAQQVLLSDSPTLTWQALSPGTFGQTFTVNGMASFDNILINFFQFSTGAPIGYGNGYIFNQPYFQPPSALSPATCTPTPTGCLGFTTGDSTDWSFPSVTLTGGIQYFLYTVEDISTVILPPDGLAGVTTGNLTKLIYFISNPSGSPYTPGTGILEYKVTGVQIGTTTTTSGPTTTTSGPTTTTGSPPPSHGCYAYYECKSPIPVTVTTPCDPSQIFVDQNPAADGNMGLLIYVSNSDSQILFSFSDPTCKFSDVFGGSGCSHSYQQVRSDGFVVYDCTGAATDVCGFPASSPEFNFYESITTAGATGYTCATCIDQQTCTLDSFTVTEPVPGK